jgi:hypothetical protein
MRAIRWEESRFSVGVGRDTRLDRKPGGRARELGPGGPLELNLEKEPRGGDGTEKFHEAG